MMRIRPSLYISYLVRLLGILVCALALHASADAQTRQAVAGTTVSLVPMRGFVPAKGFAGFANEALQGTVLVAELPAEAHPQLAQLFADVEAARTRFAAQGVRITAREEIETAAGRVPLLVGTQRVAGEPYSKWIALYKGVKTVMITVQVPERAALDTTAVKTMLASVSLGAATTIADKLKALPFLVEPRAPFRVVDTLGGAGVLMVAGDLDVDPAGVQPMLIVAYQLSGTPAHALEAAAERLLKQTKEFEAAQIETREQTPFAGSTGVLLTGTHATRGTSKRFAQYLASNNRRYIRMIVSADGRAFAELQPTIAAIAKSVAFKGPKTGKQVPLAGLPKSLDDHQIAAGTVDGRVQHRLLIGRQSRARPGRFPNGQQRRSFTRLVLEKVDRRPPEARREHVQSPLGDDKVQRMAQPGNHRCLFTAINRHAPNRRGNVAGLGVVQEAAVG